MKLEQAEQLHGNSVRLSHPYTNYLYFPKSRVLYREMGKDSYTRLTYNYNNAGQKVWRLTDNFWGVRNYVTEAKIEKDLLPAKLLSETKKKEAKKVKVAAAEKPGFYILVGGVNNGKDEFVPQEMLTWAPTISSLKEQAKDYMDASVYDELIIFEGSLQMELKSDWKPIR